MKKLIITTLTALILVLGVAGTSQAAVIQPLKELPGTAY